MLSIYIGEYIAERRFSLDPGNILILVYNIFESEAQRFNQMIIVFYILYIRMTLSNMSSKCSIEKHVKVFVVE